MSATLLRDLSLPAPYEERIGADTGDPRPLSASLFLLSLPGFFEQFNPVPSDYFIRSTGRVLIACPCGRRPILNFGELRTCENAHAWLPESGCERTYFLGMQGVYVAGGPLAEWATETKGTV